MSPDLDWLRPLPAHGSWVHGPHCSTACTSLLGSILSYQNCLPNPSIWQNSWAGEAGPAPSLDPGSPKVEPGLLEALPSLQPLHIQANFPSLIIISNQRATGSTVLLPGKEGAEPSVAVTGLSCQRTAGLWPGNRRVTHGARPRLSCWPRCSGQPPELSLLRAAG